MGGTLELLIPYYVNNSIEFPLVETQTPRSANMLRIFQHMQ